MRRILNKIPFVYLCGILLGPLMVACSPEQQPAPAHHADPTDSVVLAIPDAAHNSRNALDWDGIYQGYLPCADCDAIDTRLTLNQDSSYRKRVFYMGKSDQALETRGQFEWNAAGSTITLTDVDAEQTPAHYFVGEGYLLQLDLAGDRITGALADAYRLSKITPELEDTYWLLVSLNDQPVSVTAEQREPHLILLSAEQRAVGSDGCNRFFGGYTLEDEQTIHFAPLAATRMACLDTHLPSGILDSIQEADGYTMRDGLLILSRDGQPFARFRAQ